MSTQHTNAAELARLAGLSREWMTKILARGDIPEAVRIASGDRTFWRIPCDAATRWLRGGGVRVKRWEAHPVYRELSVGVVGGQDRKGKAHTPS